MLQNPIACVFGSQVSSVIAIGVEDMSERDEFSMTMGSITIVVWGMRCIAPDSIAALFISAKSLNKLGKEYTCLQPHARATCPATEQGLSFLTRKETLQN